MANDESRKPVRYYVDFENVRGAGLKGIDELDERDEVLIFFSQAAETFHIEHAIDILNSRARVRFIEIDNGTTNALDFQLITALFGTIDPAFDYAIVSGDGGFDAALKMAARLELPQVVRIANILGDEAPANSKTRTRRGGRGRKSAAQAEAKEPEKAAEPAKASEPKKTDAPKGGASAKKEPAEAKQDDQPAEPEAPKRRRRTRSVKATAEAQPEPAPEAAAEQAEAASPTPEAAPAPAEPAPEPPAEADASPAPARKKRTSRGSGKSGKREEVAACLASHGAELSAQELSTVMQALNGVKGMQQFYRRFVQLEGREQGLELYRRVKGCYDQLVEIVRA